MSYDWDEERGFYFHEEELPFDDCVECPQCGSFNTTIIKSYENADADGNRGVWMKFLKCHNCTYED